MKLPINALLTLHQHRFIVTRLVVESPCAEMLKETTCVSAELVSSMKLLINALLTLTGRVESKEVEEEEE